MFKDAISFPPVEDVRGLMKREKLLANAMEELKERMEELKV